MLESPKVKVLVSNIGVGFFVHFIHLNQLGVNAKIVSPHISLRKTICFPV